MPPILVNRQRKIKVPVIRLQKFAAELAERQGAREEEFSIVLVTDAKMRGWNRQFRGKDKPTDVLSFPAASDEPQPGMSLEPRYLGDIIISVETARRQAAEQRHSLEWELKVLMLHGLLHLQGYDHETDQGQMRRKEMRLRRQLPRRNKSGALPSRKVERYV